MFLEQVRFLDVNGGTFTADGPTSIEFLNTSTDITIDGGSFTATENNMSLSGNLVQTAGSFAHNSGTVVFCFFGRCKRDDAGI